MEKDVMWDISQQILKGGFLGAMLRQRIFIAVKLTH
jgi:hypothetical protein